MIGKTFGRMTVICRNGSSPNNSVLFLCKCSCGNTKTTRGCHLRSGAVKSCGCLAKECSRISRPKHGHTLKGKRHTYYSWIGMKTRCTYKKHPSYHRYGGRGITVCERWNGETGFQNFLADMGERPPGMELDRIDNDKGYEPGNCRWATLVEQGRNRSNNHIITVGGVTKCLSEWAEATKTLKTTIRERLRRGWSAKDSVFGKSGKAVWQ